MSALDNEKFLDEWVEQIENWTLQFGGSLDSNTQVIRGVIDFLGCNQAMFYHKMYLIQSWLYSHINEPIILSLYAHCACPTPVLLQKNEDSNDQTDQN